MNRTNLLSRVLPMTTLALVLAAGSLVGCSGFGNYDPNDRKADLSSLPDPNQPNMQRVITASLRYVLDRYRQGGTEQSLAINLPPGMRKSNYEVVATQAGPNVFPLTQEIANTRSMPIYHVGAIQLSGNGARVEIFRPTTEIEPDPKTGKPVYQVIAVRLEGGLQQWRAVHGQSYFPGTFEAPMYYAIPPLEDAFQFENWKKAQRELAVARERSNLDQRIEKLPTGDSASGMPTPPPAKEIDSGEARADGQPATQPESPR